MLALKQFSEEIGFQTECGKSSLDFLPTNKPCILHWNQNHFVVLYKIRDSKYYIADPGKGLLTYEKEEFSKHWVSMTSGGYRRGIVMYMEPSDPLDSRVSKNESASNHSIRFLFGYVNKNRKYFFQILLGLFVGCIFQLVLPFLMQNIVDVGIKNQDLGFVWMILIGQLVITLSRTSIDFIRRWLLLHITMRINISLLSDFFIKLLQLPMSFFETKLMGDLMQRIGDHSRVNTFLTQHVLNVIFSLISFIVLGSVLLIYEKVVFLIFCIGSIAYGGWITIFLHRRRILDYDLFEQQATNNNKTYQFLSSMQEIKLQGCEQRRRWEWEDIQADLFLTQMKVLKLSQTQEAGSIFINEIKNIVITVASATAVIHGDITLGMMLSIQFIIGQLSSPIEQLMNFVYSIQDVKISLERINEIHKRDNEGTVNHSLSDFRSAKYDIELNNVDFKYDKYSLSKTLENINVYIPEGKITAIVGASGSGKSTMIKLMLGYYPLIDGQIKIAGHIISEYNLKWWRQQCGVVMQDGVIFSESIARNIAVDDDDIDEEKLEMASEVANVKEFVMSLPLKYNTMVGRDGMGLSQGQKQRILIARAVYKNPRFIFLDEATNSLDAGNERVIVENLNRFYKGKTVVVVAHRLSTVKNADQIVVLEKGKVVEIGDHSTLTLKRGAYYNLVKNQLELGK